VNGRVKNAVPTEAECAGVCDTLPACVGYAYTASGTYAGKCFVHGPALEVGLPPYVSPGSATEWQGYAQTNVAIGNLAAGDSTNSIQCKRVTGTSTTEARMMHVTHA
jgi:hypothetical protein